MKSPTTIVIGTRGSGLAIAQTTWVKEQLEKCHPRLRFETKIIKTTGDKLQKTRVAGPLPKGLFTKEIESAMLLGKIDLAVHSLKDMPVEETSGLLLGAIPKRADYRDALISRKETAVEHFGSSSTLVTNSPRRRHEIARLHPDFKWVAMRGNIDTRIRRFEETLEWSGLILAVAGLERLRPPVDGLVITPIPTETILPAPGQGALAIQCRADDGRTREIVTPMNHFATRLCVETERQFLAGLGGGCQMPLGTLALHSDGKIRFKARLYTDGGQLVEWDKSWLCNDAPAAAYALAAEWRSGTNCQTPPLAP